MIVPVVGCIIAGCLQHVPIDERELRPSRVFSSLTTKKPKKEIMACYVNGVFHKECPR